MSYSLRVYLVDLNEVRRMIGSNDADLLAQLKRHADEYREVDDHGSNDSGIDGALTDLVQGAAAPEALAYMFGYALEVMCRFIGEPMASTLFEGTSGAYLEEIKYVLPLITRGPPFDLQSWEDFPRVGYLTRDECASHEDIDLSHPEQEVRAGRNEVSEWIAAAAAEQKDLIGFWA